MNIASWPSDCLSPCGPAEAHVNTAEPMWVLLSPMWVLLSPMWVLLSPLWVLPSPLWVLLGNACPAQNLLEHPTFPKSPVAVNMCKARMVSESQKLFNLFPVQVLVTWLSAHGSGLDSLELIVNEMHLSK